MSVDRPFNEAAQFLLKRIPPGAKVFTEARIREIIHEELAGLTLQPPAKFYDAFLEIFDRVNAKADRQSDPVDSVETGVLFQEDGPVTKHAGDEQLGRDVASPQDAERDEVGHIGAAVAWSLLFGHKPSPLLGTSTLSVGERPTPGNGSQAPHIPGVGHHQDEASA